MDGHNYFVASGELYEWLYVEPEFTPAYMNFALLPQLLLCPFMFIYSAVPHLYRYAMVVRGVQVRLVHLLALCLVLFTPWSVVVVLLAFANYRNYERLCMAAEGRQQCRHGLPVYSPDLVDDPVSAFFGS